jgi:hypothetical protein
MSFEIGNPIKVVLVSPKGEAVLDFDEMPYNEFLLLQESAKKDDKGDVVDQFGNLVKYCKEVKGVVFAGTTEALTLERLKSKNIPTSFMFAVCNGYIKAMTEGIKPQEDPKKGSAGNA